MHASIPVIRKKKTYNQNNIKAVKQNSICCKTKIYLASFFLEECNRMVTHASISNRLENFILKPNAKHCINFSVP